MQTVNYVFYSDYLKNRKAPKNSILVSKTKNSVLIGPKIDDKFDEFSFYKRLLSTSIYDINMYKKMLMKNTVKKIICICLVVVIVTEIKSQTEKLV